MSQQPEEPTTHTQRNTHLFKWTIAVMIIAGLIGVTIWANATGNARLYNMLWAISELLLGICFTCAGIFIDSRFTRAFLGTKTALGNKGPRSRRSWYILCGLLLIVAGTLMLARR